MAENTPTPEEWRKLYEAVIRIKEIAPWEWMTETDVFGVQNPETDELGFVTVMGLLGEHYAVAVYLGSEGLYGFWALQDTSPLGSPERLLEIPQLQASFEDRNELENKDREIIKATGLNFRGRKAWPMFRSLRPGFLPWFIEAEEARFLAHALEQVPAVASRFREDPALLETHDDARYLVACHSRKVAPSSGRTASCVCHRRRLPPSQFPWICRCLSNSNDHTPCKVSILPKHLYNNISCRILQASHQTEIFHEKPPEFQSR